MAKSKKVKSEDARTYMPALGFQIVSITIGQSSVLNQFEKVEDEKVALELGWSFDGKRGENQINIQLNLRILLEEEVQVSLMINNHYVILNPQILENEPVEGIPLGFLRTIVNMSLGTARGIVAQITAGTYWQAFPIPVQNILELVPDGTKKFLS